MRERDRVRGKLSRGGGTGRRARLKIWWWKHRVGSIPTLGTNKSRGYSDVALLIFGSVFSLCQICATFIQNTWLRELLSILRPTNLSFAEWPSMFGNAKMPRPCLI